MFSDRELAHECARRAAPLIVEGFESDRSVDYKGSVDPVTAVDRAAEHVIRSLLADHRPADSILGEEEGGTGWSTGRVWIVDPLDGTVNFVHRLPLVAVSVALWEDGSPVVGVVHDVFRNETFAAESGVGATLNGRPIGPSRVADPAAALIATGFPYDRQLRAAELATVLGRVLSRVQGIRRLGSAALDLCYVACGRFDGYWEEGLQPWDAAAATLVVTEAGGRVTDVTGAGHQLDSATILATNGLVHEQLRAIVAGRP